MPLRAFEKMLEERFAGYPVTGDVISTTQGLRVVTNAGIFHDRDELRKEDWWGYHILTQRLDGDHAVGTESEIIYWPWEELSPPEVVGKRLKEVRWVEPSDEWYMASYGR